ncbi:MAG: hypothetical protein ISQ14_00255 [Verrucomicrobiae bacterium]|jgi:hypothetical protein|nr:hypothetical protein [Verrucomicrobiae bacterium]
MTGRHYKKILMVLAVLALTVNSWNQQGLNNQRETLGLTRLEPLENAPPVLAFSTVALGGFRGLIVNFLFLRSNQLQQEGKYFETLTLGDWITKLQPTFTPVWRFQAWNMSYNISRTFDDPADRWRWVWSGIKMLRDDGLRYNPTDTEMYRELGWLFFDKIGRFGDRTHFAYKRVFFGWMNEVFPDGRPDYERFLNPKTDQDRRMASLLTNSFKMEVEIVRETDNEFGPLDWRLPETHAIYWSVVGMKRAKTGDPIVIYRILWQSMLSAFQRGTVDANPHTGQVEFSPNIKIIEKVNMTYEKIKKLVPEKDDYVGRGQEFFLHDAVYFLYLHNRVEDAKMWYEYLRTHFPEGHTWVRDMPLEDFVLLRIQKQVNSATPYKNKAIVEAYLGKSFYYLALGDGERAQGHAKFAKKAYDAYHKRLLSDYMKTVQGLSSYEQIRTAVLVNCLSGQGMFNDLMAERLRIALGLPEDWRKELRAEVVDNLEEEKKFDVGRNNQPKTEIQPNRALAPSKK